MLGWSRDMNREIVLPGGAGIYPIVGDVISAAGSPRVTVVGIQSVPVSSSTPGAANNLQYDANTNQWTATAIACISVDGVVVSYDYMIAVNATNPPIAVS
jgi:hypothetical protein